MTIRGIRTDSLRTARLFALALAVVLAGGCQKKPTQANALKGEPAPGCSFRMTLQATPNPAKYNQQATFQLSLADLTTGKPVEGANVTADLLMPGMDMGTTHVPMQDMGHGNYRGTGSFSMGGDWNVVVSAVKAGTTGKTTFHISVEL